MSTAFLVYIYTGLTHSYHADNYAGYTIVGTLRAGGSRTVAYLSVSMTTSYNRDYVNKHHTTLCLLVAHSRDRLLVRCVVLPCLSCKASVCTCEDDNTWVILTLPLHL